MSTKTFGEFDRGGKKLRFRRFAAVMIVILIGIVATTVWQDILLLRASVAFAAVFCAYHVGMHLPELKYQILAAIMCAWGA